LRRNKIDLKTQPDWSVGVIVITTLSKIDPKYGILLDCQPLHFQRIITLPLNASSFYISSFFFA